MKKFILFLLSLMLVAVVIVACSDEEQDYSVDPQDYDVNITYSAPNSTLLSTFTFYTEVVDDNDNPSEKSFKWDYDGDGNWDTDWQKEESTTWKYKSAGFFTVRVGFAIGGTYIDTYSIPVTVTAVDCNVSAYPESDTQSSIGTVLD